MMPHPSRILSKDTTFEGSNDIFQEFQQYRLLGAFFFLGSVWILLAVFIWLLCVNVDDNILTLFILLVEYLS